MSFSAIVKLSRQSFVLLSCSFFFVRIEKDEIFSTR